MRLPIFARIEMVASFSHVPETNISVLMAVPMVQGIKSMSFQKNQAPSHRLKQWETRRVSNPPSP